MRGDRVAAGVYGGPPLDTPKAAAREPARAPPWALEETVSVPSGNGHRGFAGRALSACLIARDGRLIFCPCRGALQLQKLLRE